MADTARAHRLAKRIVTIVATELQHQVKDPRLAMLTVTAATVTPDLRDATVFYTVYGSDEEVAATAAGLASASGVLRSAVGQQTGVKFTPTLTFKLDTVPATAHRIDELIAEARVADAQVAQRAAGASYAGEVDPYRVPRETDAADDRG
jgi:ribosome-binding factor A